MLTKFAAERCSEGRYITFHQAAQQAAWTLLTDLFYDCFVYNKSHSLCYDGAIYFIKTLLTDLFYDCFVYIKHWILYGILLHPAASSLYE